MLKSLFNVPIIMVFRYRLYHPTKETLGKTGGIPERGIDFVKSLLEHYGITNANVYAPNVQEIIVESEELNDAVIKELKSISEIRKL